MPATTRRLLDWYDLNRRRLPWRAAPGAAPDPYRVWLSEIMLQQTTVATVIPYFNRFVARWPTVGDLAGADLDEVLHAWQGLGYYARARRLHRCAGMVAAEGGFPSDEGALRRLPGVGPYTAAAVAAIAFGEKAMPVDGNVIRVIARLHALAQGPPALARVVEELARKRAPASRPGDFAQALMDLGATVCTPRRPACPRCPWRGACKARRGGDPEAYPAKAPARVRPTRRGVAFWVLRDDGAVLLRRRAEKGLLGGMMEFPSTDWREEPWTADEARGHAPVPARWRALPGVVKHTFTHFHLELNVLAGRTRDGAAEGSVWCAVDSLGRWPLPTVMKKVARHAVEGLSRHLDEGPA